MSDRTKEYDMLRQEILQYLEEYQSVRNMMYLVTVTECLYSFVFWKY